MDLAGEELDADIVQSLGGAEALPEVARRYRHVRGLSQTTAP